MTVGLSASPVSPGPPLAVGSASFSLGLTVGTAGSPVHTNSVPGVPNSTFGSFSDGGNASKLAARKTIG